MNIQFYPILLQKNKIENRNPSFKAKMIAPEKIKQFTFDSNSFPEALKVNFVMGKFDSKKFKHKSFFSPIIETTKLDYLKFVANNIQGADLNEILFKITKELEPIILPLAKHLTNVFRNDFSKIKSQLSLNKDTFLNNPRLVSYLNKLNEKNLDTNTFLQLIELIKLDHSLSIIPENTWDNIFESDLKSSDIENVRAEIYETYAKRKMSHERVPTHFVEKYREFIKSTSDYLRKQGDNVHPLLFHSFISHVSPNNFEAVEYLSSNRCTFDDLKTRTTLISELDCDADFTRYLGLLLKMQDQGLEDRFIVNLTKAYTTTLKYFSHEEKEKIIKKIIDLRKKIEANPEKYVKNNSKEGIDLIFNLYCEELAKTVYVYDDDLVEELFNRRLDNVESFLLSFTTSSRNLDLLKDLTFCISPDGQKLTKTEKFNLARMISIFNDAEIRKLEEMAFDGIIDLSALRRDFFNNLLKTLDFKNEDIDSISSQKFDSWDITYLPMIGQASKHNSESFSEFFRASFSNDFKQYIHDKNSEWGKGNLKTKAIFEENGIDYEKWINPAKQNEVRVLFVDRNKERLAGIVQDLIENINLIRQSPLKDFFDKRYSEYIKSDNFVLPKSITQFAEKLELFIKNLIVQMEPAWQRAKSNLENKECVLSVYEQATNTLTIKDHLIEMQNEVSKFKGVDFDRTLDLTIKMWDREPKKDLFQGNYSNCCIAIDKTNGHAMPDYLLNTSFNMIEIVDNLTGQVAGNSLCFIAKDLQGNISFVIDNIEIAHKYKLSEESSQKLFNAFYKYVSNLCKNISKEELPIYMGVFSNDLKPKAETVEQNLKFLGEIKAERIYMDVYGGWHSPKKNNKENRFYKLS